MCGQLYMLFGILNFEGINIMVHLAKKVVLLLTEIQAQIPPSRLLSQSNTRDEWQKADRAAPADAIVHHDLVVLPLCPTR